MKANHRGYWGFQCRKLPLTNLNLLLLVSISAKVSHPTRHTDTKESREGMPDTTHSDPWTISVKDAAAKTGLTKWGVYRLADQGLIETVYSGSRRLVIYSSLRAYIDSLPTERPATTEAEAEASA